MISCGCDKMKVQQGGGIEPMENGNKKHKIDGKSTTSPRKRGMVQG